MNLIYDEGIRRIVGKRQRIWVKGRRGRRSLNVETAAEIHVAELVCDVLFTAVARHLGDFPYEAFASSIFRLVKIEVIDLAK